MNKKTVMILAFVGGALLSWLVCGILFFAKGKVQESIETQKEMCTELADGTVVQVNKNRRKVNGEYVNRWTPIYEYYVDDVCYEIESEGYYKNGVFEEGDQVDIYYNPEDPEEVYIPAENSESTSMILTILMVVFFLAGFLVLGIMFVAIKGEKNGENERGV